MSRRTPLLSLFCGLALILSCVAVVAPATPALAQSGDPCADVSPENCILVERSDDPYPVNPNDPTDPEVVAAGNQNIQCTAENGLDCTLRAAILKANARPGTDPVRIIFSINQNQPGYDDFEYNTRIIETWTVFVVEPLPPLTRDRIDINGFSQEDSLSGSQNDFGPTIIIDGGLLTDPSRGLTINSSRNIVRGLGITGFDVVSATAGVGIEIARDTVSGNPATGNEIYGCYIGVNAVGTAAAPNARGMWIQSDNNIIGGQLSSNGTRNLISGNLLDGIWITSAAGNKVRGTYVGLDRDGQLAIPNGTLSGGSGIALRNASGNFIGVDPSETFSAAFSNVIAGNRTHGVDIFIGSNNQILGNLIGTNTNGTRPLPNGGDGVLISSDGPATTGNQVGSGASQYTRNTISGNTGAGVRLAGEATDNNRVQGNYIGTRQNGFLLLSAGTPLAPVYAQTAGVVIQNGADNNTIGGTGAERNVISGNAGEGVRINASALAGATASGNQILGNVIGLSIPNLSPSQIVIGNTSHGVFLNGASGPINGTTISGNTIAASGTGPAIGHGVYVLTGNSNIQDTTLAGNVIGLLGTVAAPLQPGQTTGPSANDGDGIRFERSSGSDKTIKNVTIGGADYDQRNIVSNNFGNGINMLGPGISNITMLRNTAQNNTLNGINVQGATNTTINGQNNDDATPNLVTSNGDNGIRFTDSTTITVRFYRVIQNSDNGITIAAATMRDVTIESNTVLTNTLDGIIGTGSSTNTIIDGNVVRGHNGSGIRWNGPAADTLITANTVYSNTVLATPEAHGIWLGAGERASISENRSRGNFNGAGIVMGAVDGSFILTNPEVTRNGLEGIRVTGATDVSIAGNTVLSNTQIAGSLGGIALTGVDDVEVSGNIVRGHTATAGIAISGSTGLTLPSNTVTRNQTGLSLANSFNAAVTSGSYSNNSQNGVLVTDTELMTVTQQAQLNFNGQSGARLLGNTVDIRLLGTSVLSNTVNGVQLGAGGAGPHPRNVTIQDNTITGNGIPVNAAGVPTVPLPVGAAYQGLGIVFNPEGPPDVDSNPNRDIDPPLQVALSSNGVVTGRIDPVNAAGGCAPPDKCLVQVFRANPVTRDGQGRNKLGQGFADATGLFTVTVGTLPAQMALTATDGDGNTSRFGLFTGNPDLSIGPARTANARPGQVITYTHDVVNTGNMTFTNLKLSAVSSRGWDQITLDPPGQFTLKPGETRPITVVVKLPTGADQRVRVPGPVDNLTVTVEGSVQFEGQAPLVVKPSVVNQTTVLASVVLEIVPQTLSGIGTPGSTLPYVHAIRNNGNIAATIRASASTDLFNPNSNPPAWVTSVSPGGDITIQPGQQATVEVLVTIPNTSVTAGTVARTTLQVTTINPIDATQNRTALDTTTVTLVPAARLQQDEVIDGAAGRTFAIPHRATNLSNGNATFRLAYSSSLGSTVTFRSATQGVTLGANNSFTLGTQIAGAPPSTFDFFADVRVNPNALAGQTDSIIIYLLDDKGNVVGGAFVRDTINVREATVAPRLYLPWIGR
jgi:hypothetical protein